MAGAFPLREMQSKRPLTERRSSRFEHLRDLGRLVACTPSCRTSPPLPPRHFLAGTTAAIPLSVHFGGKQVAPPRSRRR
jgi:hypothetical protein